MNDLWFKSVIHYVPWTPIWIWQYPCSDTTVSYQTYVTTSLYTNQTSDKILSWFHHATKWLSICSLLIIMMNIYLYKFYTQIKLYTIGRVILNRSSRLYKTHKQTEGRTDCSSIRYTKIISRIFLDLSLDW